MALSPDQLESQEFPTAWRGADRHEVSAFLKRIATEWRELRRQLTDAQSAADEANRSKEAAIAAAAQLPVPPALTAHEHEDGDRFNELGDRIATLLRTAEEAADNIKATAEEEAAEMKEQAEQSIRDAEAEAERIRSEAEAEVAAMKEELEHARVNLDDELAATRKAAETDREQARDELSAARAEVSELLAEARSQSEFIRHEADEIVRVKVRTEMETAEKRMRILQLTEQSSRDRLVAAQSELSAALEKLDADPPAELAALEADVVLDEAHDRATRELTGGGKSSPFGANSLDEVFEPQFYENPVEQADEVDDEDGDVFEVEYTASDGEEDDVLDVTVVDDDDEAVEAGAEEEVADQAVAPIEATEAEESGDDAESDAEAEDEASEDETVEDVEESADAESDAEVELDAQEIMDETEGVVIEDSISNLADDDSSPLDTVEVPDDSGELLENAMAAAPTSAAPPKQAAETIPAALAGKAPASSADESSEAKVLADEDPLAKLVREAMQRAVESARGDDV